MTQEVMMRRRQFLLALTLILALHSAAVACPMCKDSIANTDAASAGNLPGGFNTSIFIMLGAFLGVLGMVAGVIVKGIRGR
jgi:heme/copper-type cytochrome/quinol oxidase subunit 2